MFEQLPLKDIHLPDPVSWWPPAPGWWLAPLVLVLFYALARLAAGALRRGRERRRLRREALAELARIERDLDETGNHAGALEQVSVLIRRVALTVFPGHQVAGRAGREWTGWLRQTGPEDLDPAVLEALAHAPYRPDPDIGGGSAVSAARQWIDHVTRRTGREA